jgi:hypothetical protein
MKSIKRIGFFIFLLAAITLIPFVLNAATLYGVSWNGYNSGNPGSSSLYSIDLETGAGTFIGDLGYAVNAIAIDPNTGYLYGATTGWSGDFNGLLLIDPTTGSATEMGSFGTAFNPNTVNNIVGLTFNSTSRLFGWYEPSRDDPVTIDISTGAATILGSSRIYTAEQGMAFDNSDNLIIVNNRAVYVVDQTTGRA